MNKNLKRAILTTIVLMNANYITGYASVYDNTEINTNPVRITDDTLSNATITSGGRVIMTNSDGQNLMLTGGSLEMSGGTLSGVQSAGNSIRLTNVDGKNITLSETDKSNILLLLGQSNMDKVNLGKGSQLLLQNNGSIKNQSTVKKLISDGGYISLHGEGKITGTDTERNRIVDSTVAIYDNGILEYTDFSGKSIINASQPSQGGSNQNINNITLNDSSELRTYGNVMWMKLV